MFAAVAAGAALRQPGPARPVRLPGPKAARLPAGMASGPPASPGAQLWVKRYTSPGKGFDGPVPARARTAPRAAPSVPRTQPPVSSPRGSACRGRAPGGPRAGMPQVAPTAQLAARTWATWCARRAPVSCAPDTQACQVPSASFFSHAGRCPATPIGSSTSGGTRGGGGRVISLVCEIIFDNVEDGLGYAFQALTHVAGLLYELWCRRSRRTPPSADCHAPRGSGGHQAVGLAMPGGLWPGRRSPARVPGD